MRYCVGFAEMRAVKTIAMITTMIMPINMTF